MAVRLCFSLRSHGEAAIGQEMSLEYDYGAITLTGNPFLQLNLLIMIIIPVI